MKKKIVSALLCVAMAASLVVGCGSKSGSDSGSSKGGDKLVYWAMWSQDEPQAKVIKEAISKYEKDTGVKVDVQFKGRTGQREGLEPALSAKQQIDLFDEDVNRVNGSWGKYLLDLEDMAKDYESEHGNEHCSRLHVMHMVRHMMEMIHYTAFHISHLSLVSSTIRHYLQKQESNPYQLHGKNQMQLVQN